MDRIQKAKELAKLIHKDQYRLNGESYYEHVERVFKKLKDVGVSDETILASALLHNALMDKNKDRSAQIETEFGQEVLLLLKMYKKLADTNIKRFSPRELNEKYIIQTYLNLAQDIRALLIRLADRADNIQSAFVFPPQERNRIAERALYVYSPICRLIGVMRFTKILEDEAFKILNAGEYFKIKRLLSKKTPKINKFFLETEPILKSLFKEQDIDIMIKTRIKHIYGIYRKALKYRNEGKDVGKNYEKIYDVAAMRIIVNTVENCYFAEDLLKQLWEEVPDARDDYIQNTKPSGYKSLHNTFKVEKELYAEVQIRTPQMHEESEYGPASHLFYKMEEKFKKYMKDNPNWLKELNYWEMEKNSQTKGRRMEQFSEYVYAFTPKGDIIQLPRGATMLDFAYAVHAALGNKCVGALANGHIAKINTEVKDGDHIEIRVSNSKKKPSADWLNIVKTKRALHAIRKSLKMPG